jgi:glycosyltransferase involved in cell wall biosynthesis
MIARDAASCLATCLASVVPLADELVVVDTGSSDRTRNVAREHGARVVEAPWLDDFAAARNVYVDAARGDWILSLDADEALDPVDAERLRAALAANPRTAGLVSVSNHFALGRTGWPYMPSDFAGEVRPGIGCVVSRTVRLFPRLQGIRYSFPVHESLVPALAGGGVRIRECHLAVRHDGQLSNASDQTAKAALYARLGRRKVARFPRYALGHLELGKVLLFRDELDEARARFADCIGLRPQLVAGHFFYALATSMSGRRSEARTHVERVLARRPRQPDLLYLRGLLALEERGAEAAAADLAPGLRLIGGRRRAQRAASAASSATARSETP